MLSHTLMWEQKDLSCKNEVDKETEDKRKQMHVDGTRKEAKQPLKVKKYV